MTTAEITPLILTFNEAANLGRTLAKLAWASRIVVVDSFSTDATVEICKQFPQVEVRQRRFDNHTNQWNFGLDQVRTEWVLSLDADYVLTDEFIAELNSLAAPAGVAGYAAGFVYCVNGRPLRGSLYPPRVVLFRPAQSRYEADGHTQRLRAGGDTRPLAARILHDDRKPLSHWLWAQDRYAILEAEKLLAAGTAPLPFPDRLRRMVWPAPFVVFGYTLLVKGMIWEGWPGWFYTLQRTLAEILLSLRLAEAKFKRD
jgi:glycosyltransferase involved in cell wall biosynthesis